MGGGRRTLTFTFNDNNDKGVATPYSPRGGAGNFRALQKSDLAGVIFGCSHQTFKECVTQLIFGLPALHFTYVQNISPGMPLFLFNYDDRKMHGTFEAASHGKMNINPYAWTADGSVKTQYPAQVRVCIRQHCEPLAESTFKKAISANYYTNTHFWFELNHAQTEALMAIFVTRPVKKYSEGSPKVAENGSWLSKRDLSSSNGWQTSSAHLRTSPSYREMASEVVSSGEWPPLSKKYEELSHGEEDSWQLNSGSFSKNKVKCKGATSSSCSSYEQSFDGSKRTSSEDEFTAMDELIKSSHMLPEQEPESTSRESESCQPVIISKENLELHVLEKLKYLAIDRQGMSHNATPDLVVNNDNVICHLKNDMEKSTDKKLLQSLVTLEREKERLLSNLSCVDVSIMEPLQNYLELHASSVAQMQLEIRESRHCVEKTRNDFQSTFEIQDLRIQELQNKSTVLEQKQVEMDSEIQTLKEQIKELKESMPRRNIDTSEDQLTEISNDEQSRFSEPSIYLLGGHDGCSWLGTLDIYSPETNIIRCIAEVPTTRSYAAATILDGSIYIFGGGNGTLWHDSVEQYNPNSGKWTTCPSMTFQRGSLAGGCLDNKIFAFGGGNGAEYFSEVEMYDQFLGKWLIYGTMLQKRFALAGAVLGGALYALGGFDGKQYLKSVERFDPREPRWVQLEEMSAKRGGLSAAVLNEKLYAIGGFDGSNFLSSVEVFDPRAGSWLMVDSIASPRAYGGAAVLGDSIYMIGGLGERDYVDSVETYQDGVGWQVSSQAIGKRSFLAAVVL